MTPLDVTRRALRRIGHLAYDDEPTVSEAVNGLEALQHLYFNLIDRGADLTDVRPSAAYTAGENERIFNSIDTPVLITLPEAVTDTSLTPNAAGEQLRPPKEYAIVSIAGATRQTYVWDAYLGAWVAIEGLAQTSTAPWSTQLGEGLTAMLAVQLGEEMGLRVPQTVLASALEARQRVFARMQTGSVFFQPDRRFEQNY